MYRLFDVSPKWTKEAKNYKAVLPSVSKSISLDRFLIFNFSLSIFT